MILMFFFVPLGIVLMAFLDTGSRTARFAIANKSPRSRSYESVPASLSSRGINRRYDHAIQLRRKHRIANARPLN